jgi:hypothetical protein
MEPYKRLQKLMTDREMSAGTLARLLAKMDLGGHKPPSGSTVRRWRLGATNIPMIYAKPFSIIFDVPAHEFIDDEQITRSDLTEVERTAAKMIRYLKLTEDQVVRGLNFVSKQQTAESARAQLEFPPKPPKPSKGQPPGAG